MQKSSFFLISSPSSPKNLKPFRALLGGEEPKRGKRRRRRQVIKPVMPFTGCFGNADVNGKPALDPKKVTVNPIDQKTVTFGRCIGESLPDEN